MDGVVGLPQSSCSVIDCMSISAIDRELLEGSHNVLSFVVSLGWCTVASTEWVLDIFLLNMPRECIL